MARIKSFETAAARRRKDPIVFDIDGQTIRLVASLDLLDLADLIETLQAPVENDSSLKAAAAKRQTLLTIVRRFVTEDDYRAFDSIADDLDIHLLSEMVQDLIAEYSGAKNPTKPQSSADGSLETGAISTAGVPQEG